MKIKCDLHIHSKYSIDGIMEPAEIVERARRLGYSAIAVADHNSARGWLEAAAYAEKYSDIAVVPAVEFATDNGHLLGLFIESEPDFETLCCYDGFHFPYGATVGAIHSLGGLAVTAHPYREKKRDYFDLSLFEGADGIEAFNCRATLKGKKLANYAAARAAAKLGIAFTCGSDAHMPGELGGAELWLETAGLSLPDIKAAVLQKSGTAAGINARAFFSGCSAWNKQIKRRDFAALPLQAAYLAKMIAQDAAGGARKKYTVIEKGRYIERDNSARKED